MNLTSAFLNIGGCPSEHAAVVARTLMDVVHLKDGYTGGHGLRVGQYSRQIAETLNLSRTEVEQVGLAAILHDIGKIGVPDSVLLKKGELTAVEWTIIRKHSEHGWSLLRHVGEFEHVGLMLLHHHEHFDGAGYPLGFSGEQIPLGARIIGVADAFDAMTTDRPYRKAMSSGAAVDELLRCAGKQFDPTIVEAFLARA